MTPSASVPRLSASVRRVIVNRFFLNIWMMAIALFITLGAKAQVTAHSLGATTTVQSGLSGPLGVAVDSSGDLYVADTFGNTVTKYTLNGTTYVPMPLGSGWNFPGGVAVDSTGNVYVADTGNNAVKKIPFDGTIYGTPQPLGNGFHFNAPNGVAIDSAGNVYVADSNNHVVEELTYNNGAYGPVLPLANGFPFQLPTGVAVGSDGSVYVADQSANAVFKIPTGNGAPVPVGSGFSNPNGVAVDASGHVFVADSANALLKEIVSTGSPAVTLGSGFSYPAGVAVDSKGVLYVADSGHNSILKVTPALDFGSLAVGTSTPSTQTVTFSIDSTGTLGAPVVSTQGIAGLDFTDAGTGTCTANGTSHSYAAGDTCTVDVTFKPIAPGQRKGAVVLKDNSGNVLATTYVYGTGSGPKVTFGAGQVPVTIASNLSGAGQMAMDAAGNIFFVTQYGPSSLLAEIPYSNGSYGALISLGTVPYVLGVAVDGAGNLYVASRVSGLSKYPRLGNSQYGAAIAIPTGLSSMNAVAADAAGNLFVANATATVLKLTYSNGTYTPHNLASSLSTALGGIAVDEVGSVYVGDPNSPIVTKITYSNGSYGTPVSITGLPSNASGIAVDSQQNIYAVTLNSSAVLLPYRNGSYGPAAVLASNMGTPGGIALDTAGNVYFSSFTLNTISKIDLADAPSLSFASTAVGSTSAAQTVTVTNAGNTALTFPIPAMDNNPSITSGYTWDSTASNACPLISSTATSQGTLASGSSCALAIQYAPVASGLSSGSLTLTDNALNQTSPAATQSISLSGFATAASLSIGTTSLPDATAGVAYSQSLGITGGVAPYTVTVIGVAPPGLSVSPAGVTGTPTAVGTYSFVVQVTDSAASSVSMTYSNVAVARPSLTLSPAAGVLIATSGRSFSQSFVAGHGVAPYTYSVSGSLPTGMAFVNGVLSGTPVAPTVIQFDVTATDSTTGTGAPYNVTSTYTLLVTPNPSFMVTNVGANQVTLNVPEMSTGTGYLTLLTGAGAQCGTAAQVMAGQDSTGAAAYRMGSLATTAGSSSLYTFTNLLQSTAYTGCLAPDSSTTPSSVAVTTQQSGLVLPGAWVNVGQAGFSGRSTKSESLVFTPGGVPYAAYTTTDATISIVVKGFDGTSWNPVGGSAVYQPADSWNSLAVAPDGTVYLAYEGNGNDNNAANVVRFNGVSWVPVGARNFSPGPVNNLSLAIGPDGTPYVAFEDNSASFRGTVMKYDGASWVPVGTAGFTPGITSENSLAIGPDGTPYFAFQDESDALKGSVMKFDGTSWNYVGNAGAAGQYMANPSLAFGPDNKLYLAYSEGQLSYGASVIRFDGTSWNAVGSPQFSPAATNHISLAFGPDGAPYVAFENQLNNANTMMVMRYDSGSDAWAAIGIPGQSSAGQTEFESLAFSPDGTPYVAYEDFANGQYATVMKLQNVASAATYAATNVTTQSATLNGQVNDNGLATQVSFQYGTDTNYGTTVQTTTPSGGTLAAGSGATAVAFNLSGLTAGQTYHFRVEATANGTTVYGSDQSFIASAQTVPVVTGLSPASGAMTGGTAVTITGQKFTGATAVSFGGTPASGFAVSNDTSMMATAPAGAVGVADVVVTTANGSSAITPPDQFHYLAVPAVTGITPALGSTLGGTVVTITGTNFVPGASASFGVVAATSVTYVNSTTLTAVAPANAQGTAVDVTVTENGFTSTTSAADLFTYLVPGLGSMNTANLGANQVTLQLTSNSTGTGYFTLLAGASASCGTVAQVQAGQDATGATAARFGSLPLTIGVAGNYTVSNLTGSTAYTACFAPVDATSVISSGITTTAAVNLTPSAWFAVGNADISGGADSSSQQSIAFAPDGTPYVAYVDGTNNQSATVIRYTNGSWQPVGTPAFQANVTSTTLAFSPDGTPYVAFADRTNGNRAMVMKYANNAWQTVGNADFSLGEADNPSLAFAPDGTPYIGMADDGAPTVMQYTGGAWQPVGNANIGTVSAIYTSLAFSPNGTPYLAFSDGTHGLKATVEYYTGGAWHTLGSADFTSGPGLHTSIAFSPNGTLYLSYSDSDSVTTTVMTYTNNAWQALGGIGALPGLIVNNAQNFAFSPTGTPYFTYTYTPTSAYQGVYASSVMMFSGGSWQPVGGGGLASVVRYATTAVAPDGTPYVTYGYQNGSGTWLMSVLKLGVQPTPTITAISPSSGTTAGNTLVTITGTNFVNGVTIKFANTPALVTTFVNSTTVTATTPAMSAGVVDITATVNGVTSTTSDADKFTYVTPTLPAATVTGISPSSGPTAGNTLVTITGTNFAPGNAVKFGNTQAGTVTLISSTKLTATSPALPAGTVDVTVVVNGVSSATSAADQFTYVAPPAPTVTGLSVTSGPTTGNTLVTITGTNFAGGNAVKFGNTNALVVTLVSSTKLTATSPPLPAGTVDVTVTLLSGVTSAKTAADQFTYVKQTPAITTLPTASAITYGQTLASSHLGVGVAKFNGTVIPGVFSWTTDTTAPNAGTPSESVTFTPTDTVNYDTVTGSINVTVDKATPMITTLPTASAITSGQTLASSSLTGGSATFNSAAVPGLFTWTASSTVPSVGALSEGITFTPSDTANYNNATGTVSVTVGKATPTVATLPTVSSLTYGQTLADSTFTGGSVTVNGNPVAGTFAWTTPATVPNAGTQNEGITFTPTDIASYNSVTGSVVVTVDKATPTITTLPTASGITYGQSLSASVLTGGGVTFNGSPVAGTFAWTTSATSPAVGTQSESVTFTPTDSANYNTVAGAVSVAVGKTSVTVSWATPASAMYGTALGAAQLNATASVPGTFVYTPAAGTVLGVGSHVLSVSFTPTDESSYTAPSASTVSITITAAPLTVVVNNASRAYGAANPTLTGNPSGLVNGDTAASIGVAYATTATTSSAAGTYPITASITSNNYALTVTPGVLTVTGGALTVSANNASKVYGTPNPLFSGSVSGQQNGDSFTASYTSTATTNSNVGAYPIVPSVTGANLADYTVTKTNGTLTVTQAASGMAITSSTTTITPGQSITLTATSADATPGSVGVPTGLVTFYSGATLLGTSPLTNGVATYTTSALTAGGTYAISASYAGDANFTGSSTNSGVSITVSTLDFMLTAPSNLNLSVLPGGSVQSSFTVTPLYGALGDSMSFTATGLPTGATMTFNPATISASDTTPQVVTMTIQMPAVTSQTQQQHERSVPPIALGLLLLPLAGLRRVRKSALLRATLLVVLSVAGLGMLAGCGTNNGFNVVTPQSYAVTVTATAGKVSHNFQIHLNVQ